MLSIPPSLSLRVYRNKLLGKVFFEFVRRWNFDPASIDDIIPWDVMIVGTALPNARVSFSWFCIRLRLIKKEINISFTKTFN